MGVAKFFRYISERYPCILEVYKDGQAPDFDNLYLDMNGIFHTCSHSQDGTNFQFSEKEIFSNIFHYIDVLFYLIKPRKLLFLAVDGVAPRAKINQQRGRRFKSSKNIEIQEKKLASEGKNTNTPSFDPNCITPGTEFMVKLQEQLEYYVAHRVSTDPLWRNCKVLLSGHQVPGEGEHKIMEYVRYLKTLPDYDPYARHCLYGLDADLVMLALCLHERNIAILREEVKFGKTSNRFISPEQTKFFLLHITLLREYLDIEFQVLKSTLPFDYDATKIVDDWILLGLILGNDFIPHLPDFHIAKGAYQILYKTYMEVLPLLNGYINENGYLNLPRFKIFMEKLAKHDLDNFEETYANLAYFEEKTGRKFNSEKIIESDTPRDPDLERLIKSTNEALGFSDDESPDEFNFEMDFDKDGDDETFLREFCQHKRDYYTNKLDYLKVTDDVLKSQAEGYIRALQWILFYYYKGCQSWSWYYPHHYAPFASDVVNFSDVNLDFEMGKPILPYEQLLAVLPPSSKNLLPRAYHDLIVSPNSPIKHYYPEEFETDLNGKQHEWEAVVLLPFVDEKELVAAMEKYNDELTPEEKLRNGPGPMILYSYTTENLGTLKAPSYFPNLRSNHASTQILWRKDLDLGTFDPAARQMLPLNLDPYFPGFPTFRHIPFKPMRKRGKVKVFQNVSRNENIILNVTEKELPPIEALASDLIGKIIYVNWPYLTEARVVALRDDKYGYAADDVEGQKLKKLDLTEQEAQEWSRNVSYLSERYFERQGINIGDTKILIYVKELEGYQQTFDSESQSSCVKVWSDNPVPFPFQISVLNVKVHEPHCVQFKTTEEIFPIDSTIFMLSFPHYGCMGRVTSNTENLKNNGIEVVLEIPLEPKFDKAVVNQSTTQYYYASWAAQRIGISRYALGYLSGSLLIDMSDPQQVFETRPTANIGLQLKFSKKNLEVPGYTKNNGSNWLYSNKAINVLNEYVGRYPKVVEYLENCSKEEFIFLRSEMFPEADGADKVREIESWVNDLECSKIERIVIGSKILEKEIIEKLEQIVDHTLKETVTVSEFAKPHLLFKSDLVSRGLPPVAAAEHQLLDRIISVKSSHSIPLGLRGYIIGIHKSQFDKDYMYDILFDEPFPGGMTLNCSPGRAYKISRTSFINISHGERKHQQSKQSKTYSKIPQVLSTSVTPTKGRPSSAFAQWNQYPPASPCEEKADQFKSLWSHLEKIKSQDGTTVLKKMLKINDDEKPKIEDNVKTFFENISRHPQTLVSNSKPIQKESVKAILQPNRGHGPQPYNYSSSRNLFQPKFQIFKPGNKVPVQVPCEVGKSYSVPLRRDGGPKRDSAAIQGSGLSGRSKLNNEQAPPRENDSVRRIMDNQAKLEKGLYNGPQVNESSRKLECQKIMSYNKPSIPVDKSNRPIRPLQPNHRRTNVSQVLPSPPKQWYRQYTPSVQIDQYINPHFYHEEKLRQDIACRNDYLRTSRVLSDNTVHQQMRPRMDSANTYPSTNWRSDDKPRYQLSDQRSAAEYPPTPKWRHWPPNDQGQFHLLQPDNYIAKGNGFIPAKPAPPSYEAAPNPGQHKLSAVATEFIPLQALARNRNRVISESVTPKQIQETVQPEPPITPIKTNFVHREERGSTKLPRKSKIAAKFDSDWNTQG